MEKEQMQIVIVGHVDHGKSTVIGRLLADTGSLPEGKLEQVKRYCEQNAKPFEYAFLLDALQEEQSQGITIDSARCFFSTNKRDYLIIDAPGHIEFLKNMISGAARAEAAVLVIDAKEGIKENSRRHAYMLSLLGIKNVIVCVNKMDLVGYQREVFQKIKEEFSSFLKTVNIFPMEFVPISAFNGENMVLTSEKLNWHIGNTLLSSLDSLKSEVAEEGRPLRMPVQDVYKFTAGGDDRRIIAGRIESGGIRVGDVVTFYPSNKRAVIGSIESFNTPKKSFANVGESIGVTLTEQIFVKRGEIMCRSDEKSPKVSSVLRSNVFWMGKTPLRKYKEYKFRLGSTSVVGKIRHIHSVLNTSTLSKEEKEEVNKNEVSEVTLEFQSPIAFDLIEESKRTSRFVIVDDYNISGGGIILDYVSDPYSKVRGEVFLREHYWDKGLIDRNKRANMYNQNPKFVLITGSTERDKKTTARYLENYLFREGKKPYFLGIRNILRGLDADIPKENREEHIRRLGEVSHLLLDAGLIVVSTASDLTNIEIKTLQTIISREDMLVITIGETTLEDNIVDLRLNSDQEIEENVLKILDLLKSKGVIFGNWYTRNN